MIASTALCAGGVIGGVAFMVSAASWVTILLSGAGVLLLPCNDGAGLDEHQGVMPAPPQPGEPGPEKPISRTKARALDGLFVYGELMP
jgi:hypothetical protein